MNSIVLLLAVVVAAFATIANAEPRRDRVIVEEEPRTVQQKEVRYRRDRYGNTYIEEEPHTVKQQRVYSYRDNYGYYDRPYGYRRSRRGRYYDDSDEDSDSSDSDSYESRRGRRKRRYRVPASYEKNRNGGNGNGFFSGIVGG